MTNVNRVENGKVHLIVNNDTKFSKAKPKSAHTGAYGAKPFNPSERLAKLLLQQIKQTYSEAPYITREDIMQLPALQSVATITRYKEVCAAVSYLIDAQLLIRLNQTDLCLKGKLRQVPTIPLWVSISPLIQTIVYQVGRNKKHFGYADVMHEWNNPPTTLTENHRRTVVRKVLRRMKTTKQIEEVDVQLYKLV